MQRHDCKLGECWDIVQVAIEFLLDAGEARLRLCVTNELKKLHVQVQVG
jgi:hypothetical protein